MNSEDQAKLIDYLNAGGSLYIEGADVAEGHEGTDFLGYLGFDLANGGASGEVNTLNGQNNTLANGLTYSYQGGTDAHYGLDRLNVTNGTTLFKSEDDIPRVVMVDNRGYRAIASSPILGAYADANNNTKAFLMEQYLDFLDVDYSNEGTLNGYVLDSQTQEPISQVYLFIEDYQAVTDDMGFYEISLPQGLYDIELEHPDYEDLTFSDYIPVISGETTAMDFEMEPLVNANQNPIPRITELKGNFPNPFNPETAISFSTTENTQTTEISIYNLKGQKVRSLLDDLLPIGNHTVIWNGKDDAGNSVSSGVYFYKMKSGSYRETKKMLLLR